MFTPSFVEIDGLVQKLKSVESIRDTTLCSASTLLIKGTNWDIYFPV